MKIRRFELPPIATNAWLVYDEARREAILFDAPQTAWVVITAGLEKLDCTLKALLLTHGHWDHIGDCARFVEAGVPVYAHPEDRVMLEHPKVQKATIDPGRIDHNLSHGSSLTLLGKTINVRHTPGHSPGSVLYYLPEQQWAISGDVVFHGSIGRTDFPSCSHDRLLQSIREEVLTLPDATVLHPGHGGRMTLANERETNPFLQHG